MMKSGWTLLLCALLLTACGQTRQEPTEKDLSALFAQLSAECGWEEGYLQDTGEELLDSWYPGLLEIPTLQRIAKAPMMSAVVNEVVLMQCESTEAADRAAAILEERIHYQVGDGERPGGAWYPESVAAWEKAKVIHHESYVALLASAAHQEELEETVQAYFQT